MVATQDIVLTAKQRESLCKALRLVKAYTVGSMDLSALAGNRNVPCRAHIMTTLRGRRYMPDQSGVDVLKDALYALLPVAGSSEAERERTFRRTALDILTLTIRQPQAQPTLTAADIADPVFRQQYEIYLENPYD